MILFNEDIYKQKCIIDTNTKNTSFIKMSIMLQKMGIKNHLFMLVLTQPELQGLDPHSPNLTEQQKLRIAYECKINPWYFFREVIRISSQGGDPIRYQLNRANLALIWCFLNNIDTYLTMPRQIGKTIGVLSISAYVIYVLGYNINIAMFAKDADLRTENVRRLKEIKEGLPQYLVQEGSAFNTNNQETIEYKPYKNKYITFIAQSDKKRAAKQGRGESYIWSHWDELAFYTNNDLSYPSAISASETVGPLAIKNGLPCATLITTTAGFTSTPEGKYAHSIMSKAMRFSEKIYDCDNNAAVKQLLDNCSRNGFCYLEFSYTQLGKDEKWFKKVTRNKPQEIICIDYLNKWIHGAENETIIPKKLMDLLEKNVEEPISITIDNGVVMRWFAEQRVLDKPEFKNIPFILGCDTSDNIGKDFTTVVMVNPKDMAVVMTLRCNQSNVLLICDIIFKLLERFPNSIFVPEKNKAVQLLNILIQTILTKTNWKPYKRIFNRFIQDKGDSIDLNKLDMQLGSVIGLFGFNTTGAENSRKLLYGKVLNTTVERNYTRIFDKIIVDEICGLIVRDGRIDHLSDGHDDTLIAYLLACWFIMYAKNVCLYGIDPNDILSDFGDSTINNTDVSEIKNRIKYLEDKLESNSVSSLMKQAFEMELKEIKSLVPEEVINRQDIISVSQIDRTDTIDKNISIENIGMQLSCIF